MVERKECEEKAINDLIRDLRATFPGVQINETMRHHAYAPRTKTGDIICTQAIVEFRFPGCTCGNAEYGFHEAGAAPHVFVCNGDLEAWRRWREASTP